MQSLILQVSAMVNSLYELLHTLIQLVYVLLTVYYARAVSKQIGAQQQQVALILLAYITVHTCGRKRPLAR